MNQGSISSALLCLVLARQAVCLSAHALPAVCNYTYPYITRASGPLNITVLTAKEPNMAEVSGVDAIYLYSHSYEHIGGVYRERGMYAKESHFDLQGPVAFNFTCLSHNGVKCTGVTEVPEPEKCEIENTETGMKYAVRTSIDVNDFAAYVCYIGEEASAQSVYKLDSYSSPSSEVVAAKEQANVIWHAGKSSTDGARREATKWGSVHLRQIDKSMDRVLIQAPRFNQFSPCFVCGMGGYFGACEVKRVTYFVGVGDQL
nr:unnamed protein product [Spirometra erinaceieuropaei]